VKTTTKPKIPDSPLFVQAKSKAGGWRPGSGRPVGATGGVLLAPTAKRHVTDAMIRYLHHIDISPMIVMLNDMKIRHDAACKYMELYEQEPDEKKKEKHFNRAKAESGDAAEAAARVAPYVHAKLQTVVLKGDAENPLQLNFASLRGLTDKELEQMNALIAKSAMTIDV